MNNLCADIGYKSVFHYGEQLCGDHVDVVKDEDNSAVVVLADGLGSGVKASILSTLTSKIISTMIAEGMPLEQCVETIAMTLPVDKEKNVAYSTFTIIHIEKCERANIIQFDNPMVIMIRDGKHFHYPRKELEIFGKKIFETSLRLHKGDTFIAMSDGCPHASVGLSYNMNWQRDDIISFVQSFGHVGYTAKTVATMLVDECYKQYGEKPLDDATACVVKIRETKKANLMFGPPVRKEDDEYMMHEFFESGDIHIVCGGTSANVAARYLGEEVVPLMNSGVNGIPPLSEIRGVDLVTEGIVTMSKVVEYAKNYVGDNELYKEWAYERDGASSICRLLFEKSTEVNLFIGNAVNESHQDEEMGISFRRKMELVKSLADSLEAMGKKVRIKNF